MPNGVVPLHVLYSALSLAVESQRVNRMFDRDWVFDNLLSNKGCDRRFSLG